MNIFSNCKIHPNYILLLTIIHKTTILSTQFYFNLVLIDIPVALYISRVITLCHENREQQNLTLTPEQEPVRMLGICQLLIFLGGCRGSATSRGADRVRTLPESHKYTTAFGLKFDTEF